MRRNFHYRSVLLGGKGLAHGRLKPPIAIKTSVAPVDVDARASTYLTRAGLKPVA